jgi:hypothetical protein
MALVRVPVHVHDRHQPGGQDASDRRSARQVFKSDHSGRSTVRRTVIRFDSPLGVQ